MARVPNEERPTPLVPDSYVPAAGVAVPVQNGQTWKNIAQPLGIDPWDLIDFNFPGTKRTMLSDPQRASKHVNWYLREYVGCQTSNDGENWAFTSGLTTGKGAWRGGIIYTPPPPPPPATLTPTVRCSPTTSGKIGRQPTFYRPLNDKEQALAARVFGKTLPAWTRIGIGDGLGFDGRPWTDMGYTPWPQLPEMWYQINIGDAASSDLTSTTNMASCFVKHIPGTVADLFIHEMVHVWQYFHNTKTVPRYGVWASSVLGSGYDFKEGGPWGSYNVEQQAQIVETWFNKGEKPEHILYPYVRLVVRSAGAGSALEYASGLNLNELNRDLADLRARGLD